MPKRIADTPGSQQIKEATGSGPWIFKADEWKPGDKVVYVKNPNYKPRAEPPSGLAGGKVAKFDRIEWLAMPDIQTAANALMTGEIDAIEALPLDLLPMVEKNKSIAFTRGKYPGQYTRAQPAASAAQQSEDPGGDRLCDRPAPVPGGPDRQRAVLPALQGLLHLQHAAGRHDGDGRTPRRQCRQGARASERGRLRGHTARGPAYDRPAGAYATWRRWRKPSSNAPASRSTCSRWTGSQLWPAPTSGTRWRRAAGASS